MAPVYDFRHVELDKIGRGKRIVKPPGGECSDIFGVQNGGPLLHEHATPRKTHNYMQSSIFSPDHTDSAAHQNGHSPSSAKLLDTQDRLFGASPDEETPRKIVNRQRSSIFEDEVVDSRSPSAKVTPGTKLGFGGPRLDENESREYAGVETLRTAVLEDDCNSVRVRRTPINPITGSPIYENGGSANETNGHVNGYSNGHMSPENGHLSPMNGNGRVRNPPGGRSSGIF